MSGEVELYLLKLEDLDAGPGETFLSAEEVQRARRMGDEKTRLSFIAGRMLLRKLLASKMDLSPSRVRIGVDEQGRPFLAEGEELSFSLSHSGAFIAIALDTVGRSIGVDIEVSRCDLPALRLAKRFFEAEAMESVVEAREEERVGVFLRFWTAKEAVLKALGTGLRTPLRQVVLRAEPGWERGWCRLTSDASATWIFHQWRQDPWVLSLALEGREMEPRPILRRLDPEV